MSVCGVQDFVTNAVIDEVHETAASVHKRPNCNTAKSLRIRFCVMPPFKLKGYISIVHIKENNCHIIIAAFCDVALCCIVFIVL